MHSPFFLFLFQARPLEKAKCNQWAENMCTLGTAKVLDQGQGDEDDTEFWAYLSEGEIASKEKAEEPVTEYTPLLFRVDGNPKKKLELAEKGAFVQKPGKIMRCLDKGALDENDVFLLDSGWELFVWIGKDADTSEKIAAMGAADRYAEMEPRAATLPVTVVKSGSETALFMSYF
jgi:gelsolin